MIIHKIIHQSAVGLVWISGSVLVGAAPGTCAYPVVILTASLLIARAALWQTSAGARRPSKGKRQVRDDHMMSTFCSGSEYLHSSTKTRPAFQTDSLRGTGSSASGCFGIIRSVTLQSLWRFSSLSSPVTGGPVIGTSEHLRQRYVYASLLCRAGVQTTGPFLDDVFFVFYLLLEETKALVLLAFVWVDLSAKPTFNKGKTVLKDVKIWTVC